MVEALLFFSALAVIAALGAFLTSRGKASIGVLVLLAITLWYLYSGDTLFLMLLFAVLLFNFLPATSFSFLSASAMMTSVALAYWLFTSDPGGSITSFETVFLTAAAVCLLAIIGLFQDSSRKFLMISAFVQLLFIFLEAVTGKMAGDVFASASTRVFDYVIAGTLFYMGMSVLTRNGAIEDLDKIRGAYYERPILSAALAFSALSLAGLPGLNIFVSEWEALAASYSISPAITIITIFAAVTLFAMYMKIFYLLLAGEKSEVIETPRATTAYAALLAAATILLGLFPQLQLAILKVIS